MNVETLVHRLIEIEQGYQQWKAPIEAARVEGQAKVAAGVITADEAAYLEQQVRELQDANDRPFRDAFQFFDRLCPAYLGVTHVQRRRLRRAVAELPGVRGGLIGYVRRAANRVQASDDLIWVHNGLAAAALESGRGALAELQEALAELYVCAERVGIEAIPEFRAVSRLASATRLTGRRTSMADMLASFHRSSALRRRRADERGR